MLIRVKAKCIRENFKNGEYRIFGWSPIGKYENLKLSKYFTFSTKGNDSYIEVGKEYEIEVEEISYNPNFGGTYKILSCPSLTKIDLSKLSAEEKYEILMGCTSSERIANNILAAYPNFIDKVLTEGKESIDLSLIKGVGEAYLNAYVRNLNEKYKYYNMLQDLIDYKVNVGDCKMLIDKYGNEEEIQKALKEDPYNVLHNVLRRSFEKCDEIILTFRPNLKVSTQRCACLITCVLEKNEEGGSTRLNGNDLYNYIMEEYRVPELEPLIVDTAMNSQYIYYDKESKDLSVASTYYGECRVNEFVKEKLASSHKLDVDWSQYTNVDGFQLTDEQSLLLKNFCDYDLTILKGVAGAGKTSSVKALVKLMEENNMSYSLLTPTGASALRVSEQTNRMASTIHRAVLKGGEIASDVIVVDEMSMVGLDVFTMLINAIVNDNCKVVLCGDDSQLPSISVGCVFSDLIESNKIPTAKLTKVFRYDTSGGAFVGENIRNGRRFLDNEKVKTNGNVYTIFNNYKFVQTTDVFDEVVREYARLRKKYKEDEIIILSPFNKGNTGTYKLNEVIETEYNPPKANQQSVSYKRDNNLITFRVGSRVVNTKNDYKALPLESYKEIASSDGVLTEDDVELTQLYNGQIGVVRQIIDEKYLVCQFGEELIVFDKAKINNLLLARAISTHRSQGGEWKAVINIVSSEHTRLLSKQLLYVSNTRAKEYHCDIGDKDTFEKSLLVDVVEERRTWLKELLEKESA